MENRTSERLALLRNFMQEKDLQAFIIPSTDAHISEYIPVYRKSRQWLSGFTGSAGSVVVTTDEAGLWTDSRYFLQAAEELAGSEIVLFKDRLPETIRIPDWLKSRLSDNDRVGIDGSVYPTKEALKLKDELEEERIRLVPDFDPFEKIWHDRPALPKNPVALFPVQYAGEQARSKIARVLAEAEKLGADSVWISSLDAIAWLFNIRGNDVPYNPVTLAHAFVSQSEATLFIDPDKLSVDILEALYHEGIKPVDYAKTGEFLAEKCNHSVCLDSSKVSYRLYQKISKRNRVIDKLSIVDLLKSMKNEVEAAGFRRAMVRDGVALTRFYRWLEKAVPAGGVTEYMAGQKLKAFRSEQEHFVDESFPTIAGYAANAAVVHYRPDADHSLAIKPEGFLLIDSGGQYIDGTTDITRTVALGPVAEEMKRDYTLVLKGMIGLAKAVFPAHTRGSQLDILARKAMWEHGVNYGHGTGHGVGHYLNVHEGPHSIRQEENPVTLRLGMVVTNEPGIYRDHAYGVRTENMMLTVPAMTTGTGDFYKFEPLTLCYIDTAPIIREMMTAEELAWIDDYHRMVYEKLSPCLLDDEKEWLMRKLVIPVFGNHFGQQADSLFGN